MPKWIVPFKGKLIVEADSETSAKETVNTYFVAKGLAGTKAESYGAERLDEGLIITAPATPKPVSVESLVEG